MPQIVDAGRDIDALIALGATRIEEVRDEDGTLTGLAVSPAVDLAGYDAALATTRRNRLAVYAADKRWRVETGGIVVGGIAVPTDDRAKVLLMGAASTMADTDTAPYVSGTQSVTLTGVQFKALYAALTAHVQAAFATQTAVLAAIAAGTVTTTAQIDAAAWPPNG